MSFLTDRIKSVLDLAERFSGRMYYKDLKNGLRIGAKLDPDTGELRLYLSRVVPNLPGDNEFETVLNHFPGGRPDVAEPVRRQFDGREYLYAEVITAWRSMTL